MHPTLSLGKIPYGVAPIDTLEIRVWVPETTSVAQLEIDDIQIKAKEILLPERPAQSMMGKRAWIGGVVATVTLMFVSIAGVIYFARSRSRSKNR